MKTETDEKFKTESDKIFSYPERDFSQLKKWTTY